MKEIQEKSALKPFESQFFFSTNKDLRPSCIRHLSFLCSTKMLQQLCPHNQWGFSKWKVTSCLHKQTHSPLCAEYIAEKTEFIQSFVSACRSYRWARYLPQCSVVSQCCQHAEELRLGSFGVRLWWRDAAVLAAEWLHVAMQLPGSTGTKKEEQCLELNQYYGCKTMEQKVKLWPVKKTNNDISCTPMNIKHWEM